MNYEVQRALHIGNIVINLGDDIVLTVQGKHILCTLKYLTWVDEYNIALMTTKGTYNMQDVEDIKLITKVGH